jgi:hypothetical protein
MFKLPGMSWALTRVCLRRMSHDPFHHPTKQGPHGRCLQAPFHAHLLRRYDSQTPAAQLPEFLERIAQQGGYDPRSAKLTPFKNISEDFDECMINEMLDSMTAAVEAGLGTPATFFADFFATEQDMHNFADALDDYSAEGTFWVNDRHFNAFLQATHANEENAVTYSAMADHIRALFESLRDKAKKAAKPASKKQVN